MASLSTTTQHETSDTASFVNILTERSLKVFEKFNNLDLALLTKNTLISEIIKLQATRGRLYKAWETSLRRYIRARDTASTTTETNDINDDLDCALSDYYQLTQEMIGAFSQVSTEINRISICIQKREHLDVYQSILEIQKLEQEKLHLIVTRHQTLRDGNGFDESEERLSELVEEVRDSENELKAQKAAEEDSEP